MVENPNDRQVGGTHYKSSLQHWDMIVVTGLDYLQGASSKYIVRWRKMPKEKGLQDLEKAKHIVEKMHELATTKGNLSIGVYVRKEYRNLARLDNRVVSAFLDANNVTPMLDRMAIMHIFRWHHADELLLAISHIDELIEAHK